MKQIPDSFSDCLLTTPYGIVIPMSHLDKKFKNNENSNSKEFTMKYSVLVKDMVI